MAPRSAERPSEAPLWRFTAALGRTWRLHGAKVPAAQQASLARLLLDCKKLLMPEQSAGTGTQFELGQLLARLAGGSPGQRPEGGGGHQQRAGERAGPRHRGGLNPGATIFVPGRGGHLLQRDGQDLHAGLQAAGSAAAPREGGGPPAVRTVSAATSSSALEEEVEELPQLGKDRAAGLAAADESQDDDPAVCEKKEAAAPCPTALGQGEAGGPEGKTKSKPTGQSGAGENEGEHIMSMNT